MDKELRILILEDSSADAELEEHELRKSGLVFTLKVVDTKEAFLKSLDEFSPDLILSDYELPTFDGLAALRIAKEKCPDVPFILVTGKLGEEFAIEKLKKCVTDYVLKNNLKRLASSVKRALEEAELMVEQKKTEEQIKKVNESLRLAMEASNSGTWDWDIVNNTFEWSPQFLKIFCMPPETIAGFEAWNNSLHPEDREIAAKKIQDSINDKTELKNDYRIILPNQEIRWIRATGKTFYDENKPIRMTGLCIDITADKQAEKALRISEARYRSLVENQTDLVCRFKPDGTFIFVNDVYCHFFRKTKDELIGTKCFPIPVDEDLTFIQEKLQTLSPKNPIVIIENRVFSSKGDIHWIQFVNRGFFDFHGNLLEIQSIGRDVTERKQVEEALKKEHDFSQNILNTAQTIILVLDINGNIVSINPYMEEISGYWLDEVKSKDWFSTFLPKEKQDRTRTLFKKAISDVKTKGNIDSIITKDGRELYIEWYDTTMKGEDGKVIGLLSIGQDVTERKRAEEALGISEEKYRLVVENANDAIIMLQDGKIKFFNHRAMAISGYTEQELTNVPFSLFIHPDDRDMVMEMHRKRLQSENILPMYSFRFINKTGKTIWVEINAAMITWEGHPVALVFLRDITIQKKLEEQLLQSQKMEAIGTLAGGIAHNVNNLLMTILGYTSLMLMKTEKTHPFYEKLKIIEKEVESGAKLIKQLLGFARGGKYEVRPVNVNDLIIKTSDIFGRTKKEITIHRKLQEDLHTIEADGGQIEQVLFNLYVNAWQAMPSGGSLYFETQNVRLDEQQFRTYNTKAGSYVKITVTDTGVGMDAETQKRIFEPFFTTKGVGQGIGLGLSSAYGIIKNHGGIINVYSENGHGTTFTLFLPASEAKPPLEPRPVEGSLLTGHETILIVDDEPQIILAVKELLEELGYKIMTAQSGLKAIELYRDHHGEIQLVILDMIMPEMNGKETLVTLMEIDKNVSVLLSSGYSINGEAAKILDMGCKGFIQKPFRPEEISRKIREVLDCGDS